MKSIAQASNFFHIEIGNQQQHYLNWAEKSRRGGWEWIRHSRGKIAKKGKSKRVHKSTRHKSSSQGLVNWGYGGQERQKAKSSVQRGAFSG